MIKIKTKIENLLKKDDRLWDKDKKELNYTLFLDLTDKSDEKLITLLFEDKELKEKFFIKTNKAYIFKSNDFRFFIEENKVNNSYTQYINRIGLGNGKRFIKDSDEVVLNFPYKDCVLQGGQTKEEGLDKYYEYSKKAKKYEEKESKREEIFFNQVLAQDEIDRLFDEKALVNWKRYTKDGEQEVKEIKRDDSGLIKENLIIKGNNLLALHSLKKQFAGKVKLIYIDPPYNTGNDEFKYNDKFNHSTWLTFMKNRLEVARELLSEKGVIAISCDDSEQAYLKVLADEVFGGVNFLVSFYVQVRYSNKTLSEDNDYQKVMECVHVYAKNSRIMKPNKLKEDYSLDKFCYKVTELKKGVIQEIEGKKVGIFKDGEYKLEKIDGNINGLKETWATGSLIRQGGTAAEFLALHLIKRKKEDGLNVLYKVYDMGRDGLGYRYIVGPRRKSAFRGKFYSGVPISIRKQVKENNYSKEKPIPNLLYNYFDYSAEFGNCRTQGGVDLGGGKKPEELLKYLVDFFTKEGDFVLDFFAGSGTMGSVVHKVGRNYILIEQLNYRNNLPKQRLINVINGDNTGISKEINWRGGGDFIYFELAKWNEKAKELINNAKNLEELIDLFDALYKKYFLNYNFRVKEFKEKVIKEEEFKKLSLEEQKKMFLTMLDLNQMYVPKSEMSDKKYGINKANQELTKKFYNEKSS